MYFSKFVQRSPLIPTQGSHSDLDTSLEQTSPRSPEVRALPNSRAHTIHPPHNVSKGEVCALVDGQFLTCGLGPDFSLTDSLTAKDVLRWQRIARKVQSLSEYREAETEAESVSRMGFDNDQFLPEEREPYDALATERHLYDSSSVSLFRLLNREWDDSLASSVHNFSDSIDIHMWMHRVRFTWDVQSIVADKLLVFLLFLLPFGYGAIHLSAWNFTFASSIEFLLWKIACFDIMGTFLISVPIFIRISGYYNSHSYRRTTKDFVFLVSLLGLLFLFYALSRIYIVIEAFISLRHVPIGVYASIPWLQEIPHI